MNLGKTVQIDTNLFLDICDYFINENMDQFSQEEIRSQLLEKIDKIVDREIFSQYKRAPRNSAEREYYRQQYLNRKGVTRSFRTDQEVSLLPDDLPEDPL